MERSMIDRKTRHEFSATRDHHALVVTGQSGDGDLVRKNQQMSTTKQSSTEAVAEESQPRRSK